MRIIVSLLDANVKVYEHAASVLENAAERRQALVGTRRDFDEQAFTQAYLTLREAEVGELALLSQTALLAQSLQRKAAAVKKKTDMAKVQQHIRKQAEEWVSLFLAQYETLEQAETLLKAMDRGLLLLTAHERDSVRKTMGLAGYSPERLREMALAETERERPRALAHALETRRSKLRQHMTRFSAARRQFAARSYQSIPLAGAS